LLIDDVRVSAFGALPTGRDTPAPPHRR